MTRKSRRLKQGTALLALVAYAGCAVTPEQDAASLALAGHTEALSSDPKALARELKLNEVDLLLRKQENLWAASVFRGGLAKRDRDSLTMFTNAAHASKALFGLDPNMDGLARAQWQVAERRAWSKAGPLGVALVWPFVELPAAVEVAVTAAAGEVATTIPDWVNAPVKARAEAWLAYYRSASIGEDTSRLATLWRSQVIDKMLSELGRIDPLMTQEQRDQVQFYMIGQVNLSIKELAQTALDTNAALERLEKTSVSKESFDKFRGELNLAMNKLRSDVSKVRSGSASADEVGALRTQLEALDGTVSDLFGQVTSSFDETNQAFERVSERVGPDPRKVSPQVAEQASRELHEAIVTNAARIDELSQAGMGLSMILSPIDPALAGKLAVVSENVGKIAKAASALSQAYQVGSVAAGMVATGGMVVAGAALLSAFGGGGLGGGSGPDPATMKALAQISQQIAELETLVRVNFDRVHDKLGEIGVDVDLLRSELADLREEMRLNFEAIAVGQAVIFDSSQKVLKRVAVVEDMLSGLEAELLTTQYRRARFSVLRASVDRTTPFTRDELFNPTTGLASIADAFLLSDLPQHMVRVSKRAPVELYRDRADHIFAGAVADLELGALSQENVVLPPSSYALGSIENVVRLLGSDMRRVAPRAGIDPTQLVPPTLWKDASATLLHLYIHQPDQLATVRRTGRISIARQGMQLVELAHALALEPAFYQELEQQYETARKQLVSALDTGLAQELKAVREAQGKATQANIERALIGAVSDPKPLAASLATAYQAGSAAYLTEPAKAALRERWTGPISGSAEDVALVSRAAQAGLVQLVSRYSFWLDGQEVYTPPPKPDPRYPEDVPIEEGVWTFIPDAHVVDMKLALRGVGEASGASGDVGGTSFCMVPGGPVVADDAALAAALASLEAGAWPGGAVADVSIPGATRRMRLTAFDTARTPAAGLNVMKVTLTKAQRDTLRAALGVVEGAYLSKAMGRMGSELQARTADYARNAESAESAVTLSARKLATVLGFAHPRESATDTESVLARMLFAADGVVEGDVLLDALLDALSQRKPTAGLHAFANVRGELDDALTLGAEREAGYAALAGAAGMADLEARIARAGKDSDAGIPLDATRMRMRIELMRAAGFELDEELARYVELWAAFIGAPSVMEDDERVHALCELGYDDLGGSCTARPRLPWLRSVARSAALANQTNDLAKLWDYQDADTQVVRYARHVGPLNASLTPQGYLEHLFGLDGSPIGQPMGSADLAIVNRKVELHTEVGSTLELGLRTRSAGGIVPGHVDLTFVEPDVLELSARFVTDAADSKNRRVPVSLGARVGLVACSQPEAAPLCRGGTGHVLVLEGETRWTSAPVNQSQREAVGHGLAQALLGAIAATPPLSPTPPVRTPPVFEPLPPGEEVEPIMDLCRRVPRLCEPRPRPMPPGFSVNDPLPKPVRPGWYDPAPP